MSGNKELTFAVPFILAVIACSTGAEPAYFGVFDFDENINCTKKSAGFCQNCTQEHFAKENFTECSCCKEHWPCINGTTCELCPAVTCQDKIGQTVCIRCSNGKFCGCVCCKACVACLGGLEAKEPGSTNCTPCSKGHFKPRNSSEVCLPCEAGSYSNSSGQTHCNLCPPNHYCPAGAEYPLSCLSYQVCPPGSASPTDCDPPWHSKHGNECYMSPALIVVICVISVPIVVTVIAIIIYKLCKYCRSRRNELLNGERTPLLSDRRQSTRVPEPVYSGL